MGNSYYLYTEVKLNNEWICINPHYMNMKNNEMRIAETYWSGSRSYFTETWNKMEDLSDRVMSFPFFTNEETDKENLQKIQESDLSKILKDYLIESGVPSSILFVPEKAIVGCIPKTVMHEYRGYYKKDDVFLFEAGEIDELFMPEELEGIPAKDIDTNLYQFYEWDSAFGWLGTFKEILEHLKWQTYGWASANGIFFSEENFETRIIAVRY